MKNVIVLLVMAVAVSSYGTVLPVPIVEPNQPATQAKPAVIKLEKPNLDKGMPLMKAMKSRRSDRAFSEKNLTSQQLAEILWVANGVNRDDGKRTVPSAMNRHPMDVYAVLKEGIYFYDPDKHELRLVIEGDFREQTGGQPFVKGAPLNLVLVADLSRFTDPRRPERQMANDLKMQWAAIEAGCQVQNIYLYCASEGLVTVVRGMVDKEKLGPTMKLKADQVIICAQTVGAPK